MKIVKGVLIALAALFVFVFGLVIASGINPRISEVLGEVLYAGREEEQTVPPTKETVSASDLPLAERSTEEQTKEQTEEETQENPGYYTDQSNVTTKITIDWNERYTAKAEAMAKEEAEANKPKVSTKYTPPEEKSIKVPDTLSAKSAHVEIKDQGETLDEENAKKITQNINYGSLGQNYEFDSLFYPYFHLLGQREQNVYRQIYANANDLKTQFTPVEDVNAKQLLNIFTAVCYDHPELYWIETAYGAKYNKNGIAIQIELKYNDAAKNEADYWKKFSTEADAIIFAAQGLSSDYEKEKYVHDLLIDKITYNKNAAMNQSAYSALVNAQSVCAGYARAFQYILTKLGIPCYFVGGVAGESHAWNIVKLGDGYYNVDLTWDDSSAEEKYDYFNKTDEDYQLTHIRKGLSVELPPCNGGIYRIAANQEGKMQLEPHLRTLADTGLQANDVFKDLWSYYDNCYWNVLENGKGYFTFQSILDGESAYEQWKYNNEYNLHWSNYLDPALKELGAFYAQITMEVEKLQNNQYLITHEINVNE